MEQISGEVHSTVSASNGTKNQFFLLILWILLNISPIERLTAFLLEFVTMISSSKSSWLIYFPYQGLKISLLKASKKTEALENRDLQVSLFFHFRRKGCFDLFLDPVIAENYIPSFKLKKWHILMKKAIFISAFLSSLFILPFPGSPFSSFLSGKIEKV